MPPDARVTLTAFVDGCVLLVWQIARDVSIHDLATAIPGTRCPALGGYLPWNAASTCIEVK